MLPVFIDVNNRIAHDSDNHGGCDDVAIEVENMTFLDVLKLAHGTVVKCMDHADLPFQHISYIWVSISESICDNKKS